MIVRCQHLMLLRHSRKQTFKFTASVGVNGLFPVPIIITQLIRTLVIFSIGGPNQRGQHTELQPWHSDEDGQWATHVLTSAQRPTDGIFAVPS